MISRRLFLASSAALAAASACTRAEPPKRFSITMDDFHLNTELRQTIAERDAGILGAMATHNHKGAGFVTGQWVDNDQGKALMQRWINGGHIIANHTYSHEHANEISASDYIADIEKNTQFLGGIEGASPKLFRYPFLDEGGKTDKRDEIRNYLNQNDYRFAPVTLDTADWYIDGRLRERLIADPQADLSGYRDYYLSSVLTRVDYFHAVGADIGVGSMPHTLLMHHNELNGLFLGDLLAHLQANGWILIDADIALANPFLQMQPETLNMGRSLLSVIESDLASVEKMPKRVRPFENDFGKSAMDKLGL